MIEFTWLPEQNDWRARLRALAGAPSEIWSDAMVLAQSKLDFVRTNALDEVVRRLLGSVPPSDLGTKPVRLAILGSCTLAQLHGAIRVAGLRRGIHITIYESEYGQYWQELTDPNSGLHGFKPNVILFALDAMHLAAGITASMAASESDRALEDVRGRIVQCWRLAREVFRCPIIHQVPLPVHPLLLGNNEHRLPGSRHSFIQRLNSALRGMADSEGIDLLALDGRAATDGLLAWHDPALWHRAKQEVSPGAAPMYGELLGRLLAAKQGRSFKCLVIDLDNTLWGGVVGDDGLEGLVLGQGSALGEAFTAFQEFVRELGRRGVILAVCSKNDEANALEPFEKHPEMVLRRGDIASFVANWSDKVTNIRFIAQELNIGLDSLVFVDDNPFERTLVRQELPMVAVPEVSDDPVSYARIISDAGYFEGLSMTEEDFTRGAQYQGMHQRKVLQASATDLPTYLRSLEMRLTYRRFDHIGLQRTLQLINKTNQFNLTTRRYSEDDVLAVMGNKRAFGLQIRLIDRFGDHGIISIVIGKMQDDEGLLIDTWLMSCRVLGRQVEPATLNVVAVQAQSLGAKRLIGEYIPTKKNAMVRDHYSKLGFVTEQSSGGMSVSILDISRFIPQITFIDVTEG